MCNLRNAKVWHCIAVGLWVVLGTGCRGNSLWNTTSAVSEVTTGALNSPQGAEEAYLGALWQFIGATYSGEGPNDNGVVFWSGLLSDEYSDFYFNQFNGIDARITAEDEPDAQGQSWSGEPGDNQLESLLQARSAMLITVPFLAANEQGTSASIAGEAAALAGYAELFIAEDYCGGVPLTQVLANGGVQFGVPLSTDSTLGVAEAHFRQALTLTGGDTTVQYLASAGLGRALLDRGRYDSAAAAVTMVPLDFVYTLDFGPQDGGLDGGQLYGMYYEDAYGRQTGDCDQAGISESECEEVGMPEMSNAEGGVGYNFATAQDPRLAVSALGYSEDGINNYGSVNGTGVQLALPDSLWYWPLKFGPSPQNWSTFPLATGIEARMIMAEDTLQRDPGNLYAYLNTLRAQAPNTYIGAASPVLPFGSDTAACGGPTDQTCVKIFFREKAFWLYGLGNRLGDMRREERQPPLGYGLPDAAVYPTGNYWYDVADSVALGGYHPAPYTYGTDVAMTLPTTASGFNTGDVNPNFKGGCLAGTTPATP